jgi:hypothetical protein
LAAKAQRPQPSSNAAQTMAMHDFANVRRTLYLPLPDATEA